MKYGSIILIFILIKFITNSFIFKLTSFTFCFIIQSSKKFNIPYTLSGIFNQSQTGSHNVSIISNSDISNERTHTHSLNSNESEQQTAVRPLNYYEKKEILYKILHEKNSELIKDLISKASPDELSRKRPRPTDRAKLLDTDETLLKTISRDDDAEIVEDTGYEEPTQINHVKAGHYVLHKNQIYTVSSTQHIAQARGKVHFKLKMKPLHTLKETSFSFPDGAKMTVITPRKVACEYSHLDVNTNCHIFRGELAEISVPKAINIASLRYLKPGLKVSISRWKDKILNVFVPFHVEYRVVELNTGNYAATLDNGLVVLVPTYIKVNDHIEITTRAGEFLRRTKIS